MFDKTSGFFLQRADALLAESARPENDGKDLIVASRKELDDLLERVKGGENPKAFSSQGDHLEVLALYRWLWLFANQG